MKTLIHLWQLTLEKSRAIARARAIHRIREDRIKEQLQQAWADRLAQSCRYKAMMRGNGQ